MSDLKELAELLKANPQPPASDFVPKNALSILVMGIVAAAGALVWNTTTTAPESFSVVQQQTTEIRTTVLEMRGIVTDLSKKIDETSSKTSDQQARLTGLESTVTTNREAITQLNERVTELERNRGHRPN